jgi:hypothetical protein
LRAKQEAFSIMTKRAWLALCAAMTVPLLTASCGSDEATDNDTPPATGGSGTQPEGGDDSGGLIGGASDGSGGTTTPTGGRASGGKANAGAGGTTGGSSTAGRGGGGTTGGTPSTPGASLGSDCVSDDNCGDLGCLTVENSGVPHGMCTADCLEDADCPGNGLCITFEDEAGEPFGFCFEGCTPGEPGLGDPAKCHDRPDTTCRYVYTPTGEECEADADCGSADELCDTVEGLCYLAESACMPQCGSNADCPDGMFCDPDSGFCGETEPVGDPDGTPCDPEVEEDTCFGRCITFVDEMSMPVESVCVTDCSAYWPTGCGWEDQTQPAPAICLPRATEGSLGDQGFCYPLCDCDADCAGDRLCYDAGESADLLEENFGHRAWCSPPDDTLESIAVCP